MDQIEVIIKLQNKNLMYYMLIGRSDKIEKLKEQCEKISDVPPEQQILIYKGKILSNDKFISDYNIDNGDNIILNKREKPLPKYNPLFEIENIDISNLFKDFLKENNISSSDNKEINFTELAKIFKKNQDCFSFAENVDLHKINNFNQLMGMGNIFDNFQVDPQKANQILNKFEFKDLINILSDPSILEQFFNRPEIKQMLQNYPFFKIFFQNFELLIPLLNLPSSQRFKIMVKKDDEKSMIESSNTEIPVPPDPFEKMKKDKC